MGSVGLGTASPDGTLDVVGDVRVRKGVTFLQGSGEVSPFIIETLVSSSVQPKVRGIKKKQKKGGKKGKKEK
jgi:hypothetical protein